MTRTLVGAILLGFWLAVRLLRPGLEFRLPAAVALASRSDGLDDLAAQITLREGSLGSYATYLRRFGRMTEVTEGQATVIGDRFPDGPGSP